MKNLILNINEGIANIYFDLENEKVNKLTFEVFKQLDTLLDQIILNKSIKVLIISSLKKDIFIAGADIKEINAFETQEESKEALLKAHKVLNKLENLKIPSIAYINGACLGGGLELALACTYRVASRNKKTIFSFPEVKLGFFPGLAGTIRAPKLIGLINALDLILSAKRIDALYAYKIKLVNEIFYEGQKEFKLKTFIKNVLNKKIKLRKSNSLLEAFSFTRNYIFNKTYENLKQKVNEDFKAPYKALEVIRKTYKRMNLEDSINLEAQEFSKLALSKESSYLINLFFTFEKLNKNFSKTEDKISFVTVLGNGVMGKGLIFLFSKYLNDVRIKVRDLSQVQSILNSVFKIYQFLIKKRKMTVNEVDFKMNKISYTNTYEGLKGSDFVLEAIIEDKDIKKHTYLNLEKHLKTSCILASNTSSLLIEDLSQELKNKRNFLGVHFFNPVNLMPLVEVIPNSHTSKKTINRVFELLISCNKTPILVKDCAGFIVNRILLPYLNEAAFILEEGSSIEEIDKCIKEFGMPMGPFSLADSVGLDIGYKVSEVLNKAYGERMPIANILKKLNELKLFGKKTQEGFYTYEKNSIEINPSIEAFVKQKNKKIFKDEIINRCILRMVNEAARCLEENIVSEANIIDFAMISGTGFPAYKGGILSYANDFGIKEVIKTLKKYEDSYGLRFKACNLLHELEKNSENFNTGERLWKH